MVLPLKVWWNGQRFGEIIFPGQPIRVLNPFSLEINVFKRHYCKACIRFSAYLQCILWTFLSNLPSILSDLWRQFCIPGSRCSGHQLCSGWHGFCKLWQQTQKTPEYLHLHTETILISGRHVKSVLASKLLK